MKKYICTRHPVREMVWSCVWMFTNRLGTMVQEKQVSMKDKLARKKYMGVWRC